MSTPQTLPLFPLSTVLYPEGVLPLQVFEVRYLDLMRRCQAEGLPFGVVALIEGQEVQQRAGAGYATERFHELGTVAHLSHVHQAQAGLLRVLCRGGTRFQATDLVRQPHGLWTAAVTLLPPDPPTPIPTHLQVLRTLLRDLVRQAMEQQSSVFPHAMDDPGWDDAGWLAHRWCELLNLPLATRQQLLALDNPLLRLELVGDLVEQAPAA